MEFEDLDRLFDRTLDRLENPKDNLRSAYGQGPLAEDHHLLRKAWDYFKSRLKTIDEQYKQVFDAKNLEIAALKAQLEQASADNARIEAHRAELAHFEERVKLERAEELREIEANAARLKAAWHDEREALERRIQDLEAGVENDKTMAKSLADKVRAERIRISADRDSARIELAEFAEKHARAQAEFSAALLEKNEIIHLLENHFERLQSEINRRDQVLREMDERRAAEERRADGLEAMAARQAETAREQARELELLRLKIDVITKEKDATREAWQREQAQWR
jgi:chromosome segregation ATPase